MKKTFHAMVFKILCVCVVLMLAGCKLTGTVTSSTGEPLEGVTLTLSGDANGVTTTNSEGVYEFEVPNRAADYTIIPSMDHYAFTPYKLDVDVTMADRSTIDGLDFTAERVDYTLMGQVSVVNKTEPIEGVVLTLSGATDAVAKTDSTGNYVFYISTESADYTITPSKIKYVFIPEQIDIQIDGATPLTDNQITGLDFEGEYQLDPEFSDITYYHNCDSDGPATIHGGDNDLSCTLKIEDVNPVNGTPYWKKDGNGDLGFAYASESYVGNFSIEEGRIGFYHYYDYDSVSLQYVIQDSLSSIYDGRFRMVVEGGSLTVNFHEAMEVIENVIPDKIWYFLEMKFTNKVLTVYIDGEIIGVFEIGRDYKLPDRSLRFGLGDDGIMAYDQILATNDPERSLYEIRDKTEF